MFPKRGGTIKLVDVAWVECPDKPHIVGECITHGAVQVWWQGRCVDEFEVRPGDELLVAEGAEVTPDTRLVWRESRYRPVRAIVPAGMSARVRWSTEPGRAVREVTGAEYLTWSGTTAGHSVHLDLLDAEGLVVADVEVPADATPLFTSGARVQRGEVVAEVFFRRRPERSGPGIDELRRLLMALPRPRGSPAVVAPIDGTVTLVEAGSIALRASTPPGSIRRLHRPRRWAGFLTAQVGTFVRAGDSIEEGERVHDKLLAAWGEERFAAHLLEELEVACATQGVSVPRSYWSLVVRAMLGWRRVLHPGDSGLRRHQVLPRATFDRLQRDIAARGGVLAVAAPALRGFRSMAKERRPPSAPPEVRRHRSSP